MTESIAYARHISYHNQWNDVGRSYLKQSQREKVVTKNKIKDYSIIETARVAYEIVLCFKIATQKRENVLEEHRTSTNIFWGCDTVR